MDLAGLAVDDRDALAGIVDKELLPRAMACRMTRLSLLAQARYAWQNQLYWKPSGVAALYSCHRRNKVTPLRFSSWCTAGQSGVSGVKGPGAGDGGNSRCSSVVASSSSGRGQDKPASWAR